MKTGDSPVLTLNLEAFGTDRGLFAALAPTGYVHRQISFTPSGRSTIWLSNGLGPLLVSVPYGLGHLYLWTTDLDDPAWTGLGASAFLPLIHQRLWREGATRGPADREIHSDSVLLVPLTGVDSLPLVIGPDGAPWRGLRPLTGYAGIGPFPALGHYRVCGGTDTSVLAVNLAPPGPPGTPDSLLLALGEGASRCGIAEPAQTLERFRTGEQPLWKLFILLAAALLLGEWAVTAAIASRAGPRQDPERPPR